MADEQGKPVAPELIPSPVRASDEERVKPLPRCVGCGQLHGGVNARVICLENEVRRLRAVLRRIGSTEVIPP